MFKDYTLTQTISLAYSVAISKILVSPNIRIIRKPFFIMKKKSITFGDNFSAGRRLRIECFGSDNKKLIFGKNVKVNDDVHIGCHDKIEIGDNVLIGSKVLINDHQHGKYSGNHQDSPYSNPDNRKLFVKPIKIEDNVWIGESVAILAGITIGKGSIIGAGAIVTKNIPPNCIAVGNPCRIIKKYNDHTQKWTSYND